MNVIVCSLPVLSQGADINLEDDKGCSARDFALNWFQEELDEAASGVLPEGASEAQAELEAERARQEQAAKFGTARGTLGAKTLKAATVRVGRGCIYIIIIVVGSSIENILCVFFF